MQWARQKLFFLIGFLALIFGIALGYQLYALFRIASTAQTIADQELPRAQSIQQMFRALSESFSALQDITESNTETHRQITRDAESSLRRSILEFDTHRAALTWGSETDAFRKSDGGLNYAEWQRLKLAGKLVLNPPDETEQQLAGLTKIYFDGYSSNVLRAIAAHKKYLRLTEEQDALGTQTAFSEKQKYTEKAENFFDLTFETISQIASNAQASASEGARTITSTQKNLLFNIFTVLSLGFIITAGAVVMYAKKNRATFSELDTAAKLLVRRDRELVTTNNELYERNAELDDVGKVLIARDLALTRSNERLMELDELKTKFVSTAAHQLRTPLTAIKWSLNDLLEGDFGTLKKKQGKVVTDTVSVTNRLISLINNMLDVSRLESGSDLYVLAPCNIASALAETVEHFRKQASDKGVNLSLLLPQQPPLRISIDKEKMGIVFANLLENALKYTPPKGRVTVSAELSDGNIYLRIADTGIGIPQGEQSRIFSRFFRARNAVLLETYGSGLGLAVARDIVEKHRGEITFESKEGTGTTFTIRLPVV